MKVKVLDKLPINVAIAHGNFIFHSGPKRRTKITIMISCCSAEIAVNSIHHPLQTWFFAEFMTFCIGEIVIRVESGIQGGNQIEQSLATYRITEGTILVSRNTATII